MRDRKYLSSQRTQKRKELSSKLKKALRTYGDLLGTDSLRIHSLPSRFLRVNLRRVFSWKKLGSNLSHSVLKLLSMTIERLPEVSQYEEEVEVPPQLAQEGIRAVEREFKTPVTDDHGQPMIASPTLQKISITLPTTQGQLLAWAKGPISDSLTWFAAFWLRMIKKAIYFGWNLISGGGN